MKAYYARKIKAMTDKLVGLLFPQPVAITLEMRNDLDIHTLREINVRMNGKTVGVCLNYCSSAMPGQEYSVNGYELDSSSFFAEFFATQDEAEQEYIVRASVVRALLQKATMQLDHELEQLEAKVDGERTDAWVPEAPTLPPPVTADTVILGKHA